MKESIIIFTDGSSRGNPGPGGYAAVVCIMEEKRVIEIAGRETNTTNNRMELQAAIDALLAIRKFPGDVSVNTDSKYLIQGVTTWVTSWIRNGWITSTKEEVQNRDLWELLTSLMYEREEKWKIDWKHVSGHVGIVGNERCDALATAFADGNEIKLFDGPLSEYAFDILSPISDKQKKELEERKEIKDDKKSRSRKAAHSYLSMLDGEIVKHATWKECEERVKGKSGAKFKKAVSESEEKEIIADWKKIASLQKNKNKFK